MAADPITQIKKLCEEIKQLIPPDKPKDPTDQFEVFIHNLRLQHIKEEEIVSIHRAYNYFNCLIATQNPKPVSEEPPVSSTGANPSSSTPAGAPTGTTPPSLTAENEKEMIEILLELGPHIK